MPTSKKRTTRYSSHLLHGYSRDCALASLPPLAVSMLYVRHVGHSGG